MKRIDSRKATIEQLTFHHVKKGFFLLNSISDRHGMRAQWLGELKRLKIEVTFMHKSGCAIGQGGYNYKDNHPILKFRMNSFLDDSLTKQHVFPEYKFLRNREDIGSCYGNLNTVVAALCAHECAHVFQFWIIKMREKMNLPAEQLLFGYNLKDTNDGHGELWREVYSYLRVNWVNKLPSYEYAPPHVE
ncbi:hypothetical protein KW882_05295 [Vibrio parahaemolyticus]